MAVVALFSTRWRSGTYLLGQDPFSPYGWKMVVCRFGVYSEAGPIESIAHARDRFKMWGLQGDEIATVDGNRVEESFPLQDGHNLTFDRPA